MPNTTRGRASKQIHSARLKAIRPYVDFNYDLRKPLSETAKRKIKRYFDEVDALTSRPFQVYRPRRADRLREAQEFAQHEHKLPGLKAAFIPISGTEKVKIVHTARGIVAKGKYVQTQVVPLDAKLLALDPIRHVSGRIQKYKGDRFTINAGEHEIPHTFDRKIIPKEVARLVAKYANPKSNHYYRRWLHSLKVHEFDNQDAFRTDRKAKAANIAEGKKRASKVRRKARAKK